MRKRGFTLIEVSLFLALSGVLIVGIIAGTTRSMARQRYNNATDSFADFLKGLYKQVEYPQHNNDGMGNKALYGKLIIFKGNAAEDEDGSKVYLYDIIGDLVNSTIVSEYLDYDKDLAWVLGSQRDDINDIAPIYANICSKLNPDATECTPYRAETYTLKWNAITKEKDGADNFENLEKSILIIRSPISGMITTLSTSGDVTGNAGGTFSDAPDIPYNSFAKSAIDFCLDSEDKWAAGNTMRDIRINKGAYNSSAVEILYDNDGGNQCRQ